MISGDGGCDDEIGQRIGAAARVVGAMQKEVLDRRELQKKARMRLFNAIVISTLLYAHEMWTTQKRHERKLQAFEAMCLRREEGVMGMDRVINKEGRKAIEQEAVKDMVKGSKESEFKGKVEANERGQTGEESVYRRNKGK